MFILLVERVVNVGVPLILGELVNIFEGRSSYSPWVCLFGFVGLRFLQGSGGLAAIRDVCSALYLYFGIFLKLLQSLWAPVMQYSDRGAFKTSLAEHV